MKLGVLMDPISAINTKKDTTFAMCLAASARGDELFYCEQSAVFWLDNRVFANLRPLQVWDNPSRWYQLGEPHTVPLASLDALLMRKDPPFNMEYIYTTYLLELAEAEGLIVVNKPAALRDYNEKLSIAWFPEWCPPTLVSSEPARLVSFYQQHAHVVVKPLDGMGGQGVFHIAPNDKNLNVILETLTVRGTRRVMMQRFIPEIAQGDKRILLINGEAIDHCLARIPTGNDARGNLAVGARGEVRPLDAADRKLCQAIGPTLQAKGLDFVGIDVIGDRLSEINITSPTGLCEIEKGSGVAIADLFIEHVAQRVKNR